MEIHELPGGTLADADVLAVDNGTSTRKLNFKNIANSLITAITNPISTLIGNTEMGTTATTITGAIAEHESDISTLNSKLSGNVTAGAQKTISCTVAAGATVTVYDSSYTISGKTYVGTLIYSYEGANVSIMCGYAGMSRGIAFNVHNFTSNSLTISIVYRHLYI